MLRLDRDQVELSEDLHSTFMLAIDLSRTYINSEAFGMIMSITSGMQQILRHDQIYENQGYVSGFRVLNTLTFWRQIFVN